MALPRVLKNFLLFNEGRAYLGEVPELTLPPLKRKMDDYRAGGMPGAIKTDHGMEAMELDWTAAGFMPDVLAQFGARRHDGVMLRFAGALQSDDSEDTSTVEVVMRGRHSEVGFGTSKAGDKSEQKMKTALSYYRLSVNGQAVVEIDMVNMVEIIGGVDLMADIRSALGI